MNWLKRFTPTSTDLEYTQKNENMKFNWGTGITIVLILFGAFIITLIVKTTYIEDDLVAEDYYEQTLTYQNQINQKKNANKLSSSLKVEYNAETFSLIFPKEIGENNFSGSVRFLRPNNSEVDFTYDFENITDNKVTIPRSKIINGKWILDVLAGNKDKDLEYRWDYELYVR